MIRMFALLEETVDVEDANSIASKMTESLTQAKVDEFEEQAIKALPLSVLRGSVKNSGPSQIPFQLVELQTNYDFSKLSHLEVDLVNTQKFQQPNKQTL